jgi:hypothetical protein
VGRKQNLKKRPRQYRDPPAAIVLTISFSFGFLFLFLRKNKNSQSPPPLWRRPSVYISDTTKPKTSTPGPGGSALALRPHLHPHLHTLPTTSLGHPRPLGRHRRGRPATDPPVRALAVRGIRPAVGPGLGGVHAGAADAVDPNVVVEGGLAALVPVAAAAPCRPNRLAGQVV